MAEGINIIHIQKSIQELENLAHGIYLQIDVSDTTRLDYQYRIKMFLQFIQQNGFNNDSYVAFKNHLRNRPDISISTKQKYLISAKVFLKQMLRKGLLPVDVTAGIKGFSQVKKHKRDGLTDAEILKVVEYCKSLSTGGTHDRVRAIISLLIYQGLRLIELHRLNVVDLELHRQKAFIMGKGRDDKELIHLHPVTVKTLRKYLRSNKLKDGALFRSCSNNSRNDRLSIRSMQNIIGAIFSELGIEKSAHCYRHYYVSRLVKHFDGNLTKVIAYTRHRSIETILIYHKEVIQQEDLPQYYEAFKGVKM